MLTPLQYFVGQGFNTFRVPFLLERITPPSGGLANGGFDSTYLNSLKSTVSYITGKGAFAVIERERMFCLK
jgi:endoglucanase